MRTYKITYRKRAIDHIREISRWYEAVKDGLGKEFRDELSQRVQILTKYPKIAQIVYKNRRFFTLNRFPHYIVFVINESKYNVQIVAVIHPKQNIRP